MTNWINCGSYLSRSVRVTGSLSIDSFYPDTLLSSSLLLLCFDEPCSNSVGFHAFLDKVTPCCPLSLAVAGKAVDSYFDLMITYLSQAKLPCQVMTYINNSPDPQSWILDYLQSTWPAEDSFEQWKSYSIAVLGRKKFQEDVFKITQSILSASTH